MKTMTVQIRNVDVKVKEKVEKIVRKWGFRNIQDVTRKLFEAIANGRIVLSPIQEHRDGEQLEINLTNDLNRIEAEHEHEKRKGRVYTAKNPKELMDGVKNIVKSRN